ncbi:MAG TPA: hydroxymethylbilane synthase [Accumulibacter sp.]|uniref:hydroxymethylbilane synthase n=1 Tax=Accumulibacter sp. TaxID=2053492 RepID=UPI002BB915A0|nr:hydroxymethylbilane synthase [Accumulibacter sp.]HNB66726.1 hydroxymethylbilane synthase [Accumulibacter sp.]HNI50997.1 hydroxymethylbilane synthase [Accumulibacter sp.]
MPSEPSTAARLVIASRESRLALWQAEHVRQRLREAHPQLTIDILGMTTRGDRILDRPLAAIGGKGLFIKELELAMVEGSADLAVHSMKDMPMEMPEGFLLAAISPRENPCDAFVANRFATLDELPTGAVVGTSSLRREAVLRANHPRLVVRSLRGNLDTRLRKLDAGEYDAIILAAAGLLRLGLAHRIRSLLTPEQSLPAPGQGVLGIEVRAARGDVCALVAALDDADSARCVRAERAFSRALGGSCQVPLAAHAVLEQGMLWLRGFVALPDGSRMIRGELRGEADAGEAIGQELAQMLRERGADTILAALAGSR